MASPALRAHDQTARAVDGAAAEVTAGLFFNGSGSPVSIASSTELAPSVTAPSQAFAGRTRRRLPALTSPIGMSLAAVGFDQPRRLRREAKQGLDRIASGSWHEAQYWPKAAQGSYCSRLEVDGTDIPCALCSAGKTERMR